MNDNPRYGLGSVPRFGVPEKIARGDAAFVIVVGLSFTVLLWGVLGTAIEALGMEHGANNLVEVAGILMTLGLGPAAAYFLQRALQVADVSRKVGCLALVGWFVLVAVAAGFGPLAAALVGVLGLLLGGAILARRAGRR